MKYLVTLCVLAAILIHSEAFSCVPCTKDIVDLTVSDLILYYCTEILQGKNY